MTKQTEALKLALKNAQPSFMSPGWTLVRNEDIEALQDAMKLAVRSLKELVPDESECAPALQGQRKRQEKAIKALQKVRAEQPAPEDSSVVQPAQQEPVQCPICRAEDSPYPKCGHVTYVEHPAQQEHVVCCGEFETCTQACTPRGRFLGKREALAEQPAQRTWVGLADEEIDDIYQGVGKNELLLVRALEAKLKEKNT